MLYLLLVVGTLDLATFDKSMRRAQHIRELSEEAHKENAEANAAAEETDQQAASVSGSTQESVKSNVLSEEEKLERYKEKVKR